MDNIQNIPFESYTHRKKSNYFEGYLYYYFNNYKLYLWTSNLGWVSVSLKVLNSLETR